MESSTRFSDNELAAQENSVLEALRSKAANSVVELRILLPNSSAPFASDATSSNTTGDEKTEAPGRILVVDDQEMNVRVLSRILTGGGYEVSAAVDGFDALRQIAQNMPDVVLLDVMMPEIDGFEVCRRLRADEATKNLPIVIVTALQEAEYRVRGLELGADDFLTKPLDRIEVLARVKSLLRVKRGRDKLERAFADLKRAETLRDDLAEMLVHDLRTPLTTLLGPLEMLESESFGPLNEPQREVVAMSSRSGYRLLHLINELLDISKLENGRLSLETQEIALIELGHEAVENVVLAQSSRQSRVIFEYSIDLPKVRADADLLRRVLINLLGNALKFTPDNGEVAFGARRENDAVLLWVRDSGEGVPHEAQERIFEKFGQVETRKAGHKMSTGLGLTFCKLAVEAHGGRIWLESEPNQGSTFFFTLPF